MEKHIDLDRIIKIDFYPEIVEDYYYWRGPKPIKKFFGLISNGFTEAGFVSRGDYDRKTISVESLERQGYSIKGKKVFKNPSVTVHLDSGFWESISFKTNREATNWITDVKEKSGKQFLIIS